MGRHKGSRSKINYQVPPSGQLSLDDKLKLIAIIIVDRIIADVDSRKMEAKASV
jgi:hypothetical protein